MKRKDALNEIMNLVVLIESGTTELDRDSWPLKDLLQRLHDYEDCSLGTRPAAWEHPETSTRA